MPNPSETSNYHAGERSVFDARMSDAAFAEYRRQWREHPRDGVVAPFPLHLDIEATNVCNLRCPHCATAAKHWGCDGQGFMDMDLFCRIVDEAAAGGVYCIKYSLRGESLLHPELIHMVACVRDAGITDHYFNTNGMLLTEEVMRGLIEAGLPRLSISVDGWDRESFSRYRVGGDYDRVCENIKTALRIRDECGLGLPRIRVQTVMLPEIREHWQEYLETWRPLADEVGYLDARSEGEESDHHGCVCKTFRCAFLWQRMTILWDGTLLPCLMHGVDDFSLMSLGNVRDASIKSMWHSERVSETRRLHRAGRSHELEACNRCSYRAAEIQKAGGMS